MSKKKIKPVDLTDTVNKILSEYGDDVYKVLDESITETSIQAKQELQNVRRFSPSGNPTGEYSASWEYEKIKTGRLQTESVVYNEEHYRLTHLLEFGHALKRGGRTYGHVREYPHIEPVNDRAQDEVMKKVEEKIGEL